MAIPTSDIKRLWARSAGRCALPGCVQNCILLLDSGDPAVLGEMAHVIAQSPDGPRANGVAGPDTYANLVLLCPTHHALVDKHAEQYPATLLHEWKARLERHVEEMLNAPTFANCDELYHYARRLLAENRHIHRSIGPESAVARANPLTDSSSVWALRKCAVIIPNNRKIANAFEAHSGLIPLDDWTLFVEFREHSFAFEANTFERLDREAVPRFPSAFGQLLGETS